MQAPLRFVPLAAFLMCQAHVAAQTLSGKALVDALRQGGYVIVLRHASSPRQAPDRQSANPDNAGLERQLDETGRSTASAMGRALRELSIPIGAVYISPTYRARETARLTGLPNPHTQAELGDGGHSMQGVTAEQTRWLQEKVKEWPRGTNTILLTHGPNMSAAFPEWTADLADGEALVVGPDGAGGVQLVARIRIEQWPALAAP